ncbi:GlpG protein (membrane protein of glp regulon) [hydrothermal vent metagenome]|uniref:GlpG protein (Membrane protein of glp regulon) n=1 Tax=hydrothermal vent metagenome TaxID=652676 RepID=A0A3B0U7V7_9ZZZZ
MFLPLHDRNPITHIRFPYVNYALIIFTTAIFLIQWLLPAITNQQLIISLGMIPLVVRDVVPAPLAMVPDQLTLITYAFLHAGWLHLITNMLFLFVFGDNIEDALGHFRYFLFYIGSAILAAGAHLVMNMASSAPLIGASGAVAGILGAYVVLYPHARVFVLARIIIPIPLPVPAFWFLGFWIVTQIFYAVFTTGEPVAWWAHLGGVSAGILLALILKRREVKLFGGR